MVERVQLRRSKGWRMPPNTVKVDRTTPYGNPFIVGVHGTRERCVELFAMLLGGYVCLTTGNVDAQRKMLERLWRDREKLRGRNLACWCPTTVKCHADVLIEYLRQ